MVFLSGIKCVSDVDFSYLKDEGYENMRRQHLIYIEVVNKYFICSVVLKTAISFDKSGKTVIISNFVDAVDVLKFKILE